nr:immunoglobulin heavy chain junction region [Macaca mulatta]
CARSSKGFDYW